MVAEFKTGYYYRWIGSKDMGWNRDVSRILDGKWKKCVYGKGTHANFEGIRKIPEGWDFQNYLNNFEEKLKINLIKTEEILKKWK